MKLKSIKYEGFRAIKGAELKLEPNLTLIVGNNAAGKTSLLDGCAILLSDLITSLFKKHKKINIEDTDINNDMDSVKIKAELILPNKNMSWERSIVDISGKEKNELIEIVNYAEELIKNIMVNEDKVNIPTIAYYKTNRNVLDVPLKIKTKHKFSILEAYDRCLEGDSNFRLFFEWFRKVEDIENEANKGLEEVSKISEQLNFIDDLFESFEKTIRNAEEIKNIVDPNDKDLDSMKSEFMQLKESLPKLKEELSNLNKEIPEASKDVNNARKVYESTENKKLQRVREVISKFININNLRVTRTPLAMVAEKEEKLFRVEQLSDGEKSLLGLVGDLARRLTIANPALENPLEGEGIILIDEIELHLHPKWQREVIHKLRECFPKCQFIITTHSPQVIGEVPKESLRILNTKNGILCIDNSIRTIGLSSSDILTEIMDSENISRQVSGKIDDIYHLIDDDKYNEAEEKISELEDKYGELPETISLRNYL